MKKKKIVYIAQSAGGVAEYLYMFLKNIKNEYYENILIVSQDYKKQLERFKPYTTNIYIVPMIREVKLKEDIGAIIKIKKLLKQIKPDVTYLHSSKAGAIGRIALAFNFKTKILYNAHGWYFNAQISNKKKKMYALIEKILAIKTDKIINISKNEYESALKNKIASPKKMCIIENGIDFTKFVDCERRRIETRKKYNIKENDIVIGVVGRISEQKDPITSTKAFNSIHNKFSNTKMMFVGDGDLRQKITEYARQNNTENDIIITSWVENVETYIPAFDIAILPSKWEGFGLALIEYMACHKPIVASNIGGITNIIKNNENGFLIEPGNIDDLTNKIEELINNKKIQKKFIKNNDNTMKKYDIKNVVKKHEELFDNL